MKEFIKKFNNFSLADGYKIKNIPWIGIAVKTGGRINLRTKKSNKLIVESDDTLILVPMLEITDDTWDGSGSNNETRLFISGDVTLTGKTDCYSITFEEGGHLTINGGARLRIWEGGITNNDCTTINYLTIVEDAVNDSYGEFLLHPDVSVNNHPLASVELISNSYYTSSNDYQYQRFSNPSNTVLIKAMAKNNDDVPTAFTYFDPSSNSWKTAGYINYPGYDIDYTKISNPFDFYQFLCNNPNMGNNVTFICTLYGNVDYNINLRGNFHNGFANTWTGKIKVSDFINLFASLNIREYACAIKGISPMVDINNYNYIRPIYTGIDIVNLGAAATIALSYKDLVWDPSFEEEVTPTRSLMKGSLMSSKPKEIDTTLEGSGIFDNPEPIFPPEHDEK